MTSTETTPSAANKVAKTSTYHHCYGFCRISISCSCTSRLPFSQHTHGSRTIVPPPLRLDSTTFRPFILSRSHSMPLLPIHHYWGRHQHHRAPAYPPTPTNLMLKTFSTQSLPTQKTIYNTMYVENLDVCTSPPPPIHLSSTVMRSLANSTEKTWSFSLSHLTPGHGLAQCYMHSLPPPTILAKNPGAPHTLTINITDPMPTSFTNAPPNHHAHSGS